MLREVAPARLAATGAVQVVVKPPRELAMAALRRQAYAARHEAQNRVAVGRWRSAMANPVIAGASGRAHPRNPTGRKKLARIDRLLAPPQLEIELWFVDVAGRAASATLISW
jgi:hypothetical protein